MEYSSRPGESSSAYLFSGVSIVSDKAKIFNSWSTNFFILPTNKGQRRRKMLGFAGHKLCFMNVCKTSHGRQMKFLEFEVQDLSKEATIFMS